MRRVVSEQGYMMSRYWWLSKRVVARVGSGAPEGRRGPSESTHDERYLWITSPHLIIYGMRATLINLKD